MVLAANYKTPADSESPVAIIEGLAGSATEVYNHKGSENGLNIQEFKKRRKLSRETLTTPLPNPENRTDGVTLPSNNFSSCFKNTEMKK